MKNDMSYYVAYVNWKGNAVIDRVPVSEHWFPGYDERWLGCFCSEEAAEAFIAGYLNSAPAVAC